MIALPLYERYIIAKLKLDGKSANKETISEEMSTDLQISAEEQNVFWDLFRNGFAHQAMPKAGKTDWLTSSEFTEFPEFRNTKGNNYICIDPWKFADRVLNMFMEDQRTITASDSFPLASISLLPK